MKTKEVTTMHKIIRHDSSNLSTDVIQLINLHMKDQNLSELKNTLEHGLKLNSVILLSLWEGQEVIGFCYGNISIGLESKGSYFWINEFFIKTPYRHQGNGRLLMNHLKQILQENKINYMALVTKTLNEQAIAFYQREGFHQRDYLWFDFTQRIR